MEIKILGFEPCEKNTLKGIFAVRLFKCLDVYNCRLHERNGYKSTEFPVHEYLDKDGHKKYDHYLFFRYQNRAEQYSEEVLLALEKFMSTKKPKKSAITLFTKKTLKKTCYQLSMKGR